MIIDEYGFPANSRYFRCKKLKPYRVEYAEDNIIYLCFSANTPCAIHKITLTDSGCLQEWTYGDWSQRATLSYSPISEQLDVTDVSL